MAFRIRHSGRRHTGATGAGRTTARIRRRATRFVVPRSHRLFAVFGDGDRAHAALDDLPSAAAAGAWIFGGDAGADELDPDTEGAMSRVFSFTFSHNVEFLQSLARMVRGGEVVVAVPARRLGDAQAMARHLRRGGGEVLAYTAHWNFVPVGA